MRLPITLSGALMPDGCAGYGLPIGGVLATTDDVVIPYAVGKDIACRMSLTILDAGVDFIESITTGLLRRCKTIQPLDLMVSFPSSSIIHS